MVYGSSEQTPYEGSENPESRAERKMEAVDAVLQAAWDAGFLSDNVDELTREMMVLIARNLGSYAFRMGGAIWDRKPAALLRAWDELLTLDEDARSANEEGASCPF